jgi:hypothetical protein
VFDGFDQAGVITPLTQVASTVTASVPTPHQAHKHRARSAPENQLPAASGSTEVMSTTDRSRKLGELRTDSPSQRSAAEPSRSESKDNLSNHHLGVGRARSGSEAPEEIDAGPLPQEGEGRDVVQTQPPRYENVFGNGASGT